MFNHDVIISIIVPVYKSEDHLKRCIESILNQTFKKFELILVNDGSPDKCGQICDRYASLDKRIKVIHKRNQGVSSARNDGIKLSKGKYIMFADSDDYINASWCQDMYEIASKNSNQMIISGYKVYDNTNNATNLIVYEDNKISKIDKVNFFELYEKNLINSPCNKIYQSEIIKNNKITFKENLNLGEDLLFNLEYFKFVENEIIIINKGLYNYIIEDKESLHTKYYEDFFEICNSIFDKLYIFMDDNNVNMELYEKRFYRSYFYMMNLSLKNTFNLKCKMNFIQKIKYNNEILRSNEFNKCINKADLSGFNKKYIYALRSKNYMIVYLFLTIVNFKNSIKQIIWRKYKSRIYEN